MINRQHYEDVARAIGVVLIWPIHEAMPPRRVDTLQVWHPEDANKATPKSTKRKKPCIQKNN